MILRSSLWGWRDPPPDCPVCGAPHTTCTPESVAKQQATPPPVAKSAEPEAVTFTTSTYRRQVHGQAIAGRDRR